VQAHELRGEARPPSAPVSFSIRHAAGTRPAPGAPQHPPPRPLPLLPLPLLRPSCRPPLHRKAPLFCQVLVHLCMGGTRKPGRPPPPSPPPLLRCSGGLHCLVFEKLPLLAGPSASHSRISAHRRRPREGAPQHPQLRRGHAAAGQGAPPACRSPQPQLLRRGKSLGPSRLAGNLVPVAGCREGREVWEVCWMS